ncbi:MAG: LLM class flavin-dependent oxidoreductase [Chloroflexota bacterium]
MTVSHKIQFGIKTTQFFPYADILRVWQEADGIPAIDHAWLFDHPMPIGQADPGGPCLDGWTTLAALAAQTQRLRLGLMVGSNANQTPPQLAKRAATLDIIARGRLEFGLGVGGVEREHTAYGTDYFAPAERIKRLGESCEIIKRMWMERVVDFDGQYYHFKEIYCEPKPVQKQPPFVIGAIGEQLALRVVAQHADVWNLPGVPYTTLDDFQRKSQIVDGYCADIGRDPASIVRSIQLIIDPKANPAPTCQLLQDYIGLGATHFVIGPRSIDAGIAHWLTEQIIEPVRAAVGDTVS